MKAIRKMKHEQAREGSEMYDAQTGQNTSRTIKLMFIFSSRRKIHFRRLKGRNLLSLFITRKTHDGKTLGKWQRITKVRAEQNFAAFTHKKSSAK